MLKQIFSVNFDEDMRNSLQKKDGIWSLIYFLYYSIMILLFGLLLFKTQIYENLSGYFHDRTLFRFLFYIPDSILNIAPILIILKLRKQSFKSVGLRTDNIAKQILIGLAGSIPFSILNAMGPISSGKTLNPDILQWVWTFLYFFLCIAFVEEFAFRGFLQTRIQGLIKNKWAGILIVGLLFALMHVPFQMIKANMPPLQFMMYDARHLITTCLIHIYLVYLYTRNNNLLAPTITHAIMDFSYAIFV